MEIIQLDRAMFNKDFKMVPQVLPFATHNEEESFEQQLIRFKADIYAKISEIQRLSEAKYEQMMGTIHQIPLQKYVIEQRIEKCMMKMFLAQFMVTLPLDYERTIQQNLKQLPRFQEVLGLPLYWRLADHPYHACSLIELYIRRLSLKSIDAGFIDELSTVLTFTVKMYQIVKLAAAGPYINGVKSLKSLYYILVHRLISYYNTNLKIEYRDVLVSYSSMFGPMYIELMSKKLKVCLLYNILKILAPMQDSENFDMSVVFSSLGINPQPATFREKIFCLFLVLNQLIQQSSHRLLHGAIAQKKHTQTQLWPQLYIHCCINLNDTKQKLDDVAKAIMTHRLPSMLSFLSLRYRMTNVTKEYIERIYDSPFNDDIQTIKLCFELFNSEEFEKLYQLAESVLSSEACKQLKERQILIVMCSIFKGVVMQNFDEGLVLAKLNHHEFQKGITYSTTNAILNEYTLIAHVGFAYYNMAKHSLYLESKISYSAKALQNFLKSYQMNRQNYLLSYSISKLYLQSYDYDNAYKYATFACKNNRDNWEPFSLLACIYMCRKRHHKAELIVKELLHRHPNCPTLYYIRAFTEVYKILQDVNTNQEVEASKFLGCEFYEQYKEHIIKSKDIRHILQLLQRYMLTGVFGQFEQYPYDELFFSKIKLEQEMYEDEQVVESYFQTLKYSFDLLFHLDQISLCQTIYKKLMVEKKKPDLEYRYYKGKFHEKKKQFALAIEQYTQLLLAQPYHPEALIALSMLEQDLDRSNQYVELASKFRDNDDFNFAKGMLLSRIGEYERAHSCFLKEARTCWLNCLPDFMYYY